MRGELCIGTASLLTLVAVLLLVFVHIGQISTASTPRSISMAQVNVSGYGDALYAAFSDPILGLYTNNASAPLNARAGLRQLYKFGLYSHCAYVNQTAGLCTNTTAAYQFRPYTVITSDMLSNYSGYTDAIIHNATFADSSSLGGNSRSAYYLLLLGSILATISLATGVIKHTWAFFISTLSATMASIFVLAGSALWTVLIKRAKDINTWTVRPAQVPLGIEVSTGVALYLTWAAFACLATSIIPYMISCCTFRG
ncbi:hypothetical protein BDM02DRAFT_3092710 [Thelephora ganbajun]|uniref:Uncharacterized protein n=1 Tax=Thelephora ganbajun TaxID=370292 RepID=A0ACB6ZN17_THEGA|nr:hypothetical protein BDM02DRAFT_3092710 [Thelephora ganbajun]